MSKKMGNKNRYFGLEIGAVIVCVLIAVIFVLTLVFATSSTTSGGAEPASSVVVGGSSETVEESGGASGDTSGGGASEEGGSFKTEKVDNANAASGDLILVNRIHEYVFPSANELEKIYEFKTASYKLGDTNIYLKKYVIEQLNKMSDAFYAATEKKNLTVTTGYLDKAAQTEAYNKKVSSLGAEQADIWAQKGGFSEHHTGLAFNLTVYPSDGEAIGEGSYKWITDNAWQYGFIRRYPEGKQDKTYIKDDQNHFRYVGVAHACYMHLNDLCLEEYIELLRFYTYDNPLEISDGVNSYEVYCCPVSGTGFTELTVPAGKEYSVSGDNCGSFIITVKK